MEQTIIRVIKMPSTVRGMTILDNEGDYNIYLNNTLSHEQQKEILKHELNHIKQAHFFSLENIRHIEKTQL